VIGFGNAYRRDDGAGFAVVNALRSRIGLPALDEDEDGFDQLGREVDTVILHQLVPELADTVHTYDLVVFVDAHMGSIPELVREEELDVCYKSTTVSHQVHPCSLLAISEELYGHAPRGVLLSLRGYDFEFGLGLSDGTADLVPGVVERVLALAREA